jgi:hypothetical protein
MFDNASFDLIINPNQSLLVSGTVDGKHTAATGSLYSGGTALIKGTIAGLGLIGHLDQQDQAPAPGGYVTTTKVVGSVGQDATTLDGSFRLNSEYIFQSGDITGLNHGVNVQATALPIPGTGIGNGAAISGAFGSTPFSLSALISGNLPGSVVGTVDSRPVHFNVTNGSASKSEDFRILRLNGSYSGPADLFALIIGGITYFGA